MIDILYSPNWFYWKDIGIDVISLIVLSLLAFYSYSYYQLNQKSKYYLQLTWSFIFLAASFLLKILMNFAIYSEFLETETYGYASTEHMALTSPDTLFFIGFLLYRLVFLLGLYVLYSVYNEPTKGSRLLVIYLLLLTTYLSLPLYIVFHMTAFVLLLLITYQYFSKYEENHNDFTFWLGVSFSIITLSQVIFGFIVFDDIYYVVAELVQLVGYALLLFTFLQVLGYGKETDKNRHHR